MGRLRHKWTLPCGQGARGGRMVWGEVHGVHGGSLGRYMGGVHWTVMGLPWGFMGIHEDSRFSELKTPSP